MIAAPAPAGTAERRPGRERKSRLRPPGARSGGTAPSGQLARTLQLTVSVASSAAIPQVSWRLERMVRPRRIGSGDPEPELPL